MVHFDLVAAGGVGIRMRSVDDRLLVLDGLSPRPPLLSREEFGDIFLLRASYFDGGGINSASVLALRFRASGGVPGEEEAKPGVLGVGVLGADALGAKCGVLGAATPCAKLGVLGADKPGGSGIGVVA